jgi:predicted nucleic acid-binding protein
MILGTDVLIDLERKHAPALAWFAGLPGPPSVAGFAAMEMISGCQNGIELSRTLKLLRRLVVVWPDEAALSWAKSEYEVLRLSQGIGLLDMLIAATATGHGQPLATFNIKHFVAIPGLATMQPYTR